jgi:hypothetical protein
MGLMGLCGEGGGWARLVSCKSLKRFLKVKLLAFGSSIHENFRAFRFVSSRAFRGHSRAGVSALKF